LAALFTEAWMRHNSLIAPGMDDKANKTNTEHANKTSIQETVDM